MKFKKLQLDESLFDDDSFDWNFGDDITVDSSYDDEFTDPEEVPVGPMEGADVGVADLIITAINNAWDTVKQNNSIIATLRANNGYETFIPVIDQINNDVNRHIGQFQELLKTISPNAEAIESGQSKTHSDLEFQNGKLKVQFWDCKPENTIQSTPNCVEDICTLDDVDDDM